MRFRLLFFLMILAAADSHSAVLTWNKENFQLDYPSTWKSAQNFFGVPITLFGPMTAKQIRPIIQIIPSQAKALALSEKELQAFNRRYPEEKKSWLKKRDGELLSLLPAAIEDFGKDQKAIVAGLAYRLGEHAFTEKTFYLNCRNKVVQLKLLVPLGETVSMDATEKVVRSFRCE